MYKLTIHTDNGTFEINIDKLQELGTILINYDGYDYVRATQIEEDNEKANERERKWQSLKKLKSLQKK